MFKMIMWEGKPLLESNISEQGDKPFAFGVTKAKLILANIDTIKAFVAKYDKPKNVNKQIPSELMTVLNNLGYKVTKM